MYSKIVLLLVLIGIDAINNKGQSEASDCGGSGKLLKPIILEGCDKDNCKLTMNRSYNLSIPEFSPGKNYKDLTFILTASSSVSNLTFVSKSVPLKDSFQDNETYSVNDYLSIDSKFAKDLTWTIQAKIIDHLDQVIICTQIKIVIENNVVAGGEPLANNCDGTYKLYQACGNANSRCLPQSTGSPIFECRCDYSFHSESNVCKGIIGTVCGSSSDCVEDAVCERVSVYSIHTCTSSSSTSISGLTSSLLAVFIVVLRNSFVY